jgi:hypothetical protein
MASTGKTAQAAVTAEDMLRHGISAIWLVELETARSQQKTPHEIRVAADGAATDGAGRAS